MAHEQLIAGGRTYDMGEVYTRALALLDGAEEDHHISTLANVASLLYDSMEDVMWVGFYAVKGEQLVLYPFQGPVACTTIQHGKGVCGTAWAENRTIIVPDVEAFPGHIACSSHSRSEIVIPLHDTEGRITHILDIDSASLDRFGDQERHYLELICEKLSRVICD